MEEESELELRKACESGDVDTVQRLIRDNVEDINIDCADSNGQTPLHFASYSGHTNVVHLLIHSGANIHCTINIGCTPLHMACWQGHTDTVLLLLEKGANVHRRTKFGRTALHGACRSCLNDPKHKVDVLRVLFDWGANVDCQDNDGDTPLHEAARYDTEVSMATVRFLVLEMGANLASKNNDGMIPLDRAREMKNKRMEDLLTLLCEVLHATSIYSIVRDNPTLDPLSKLRAL